MEYRITLRDEFIKLGQALKAANLIMSGGEAKELITAGGVKVNGETELRRGRKLRAGDRVECGGDVILVEAGHADREDQA